MATTFAAHFREISFLERPDLGAIDRVSVLTRLRRLLRVFSTHWSRSTSPWAELALASSGE